MRITKLNITPGQNSANHSLLVTVDFDWDFSYSLPIHFGGSIKATNEKIRLGFLYCEQSNNYNHVFREYGLSLNSNSKDQQQGSFQKDFIVELTPKAIQTIEDIRHKDDKKQIALEIEVDITILKREHIAPDLLKTDTIRIPHKYEIPQSIWIQEFAEYLGLGKYLLIEFSLASENDISSKQNNLIKRAHEIINDMHKELNDGRWEKVIEESRKIWELFRIPRSKKDKEFEALFESNNYSSEGVQSLQQSLWNIHDYASKFIHTKDKSDNLSQPVYARKEDAYFIYIWAVGFINMISEKVKNSNRK